MYWEGVRYLILDVHLFCCLVTTCRVSDPRTLWYLTFWCVQAPTKMLNLTFEGYMVYKNHCYS